jgi:Flp pilus assembly protein CpaB
MSVAVAPEHAAAGLWRAGDRVTVLTNGKPGVTTASGLAGVLLSPVRVLSVLPKVTTSARTASCW